MLYNNQPVYCSRGNKALVKMYNNDDFPAWHNGKFCQVSDLHISIRDLGLLRSYGVYDVVSVKNNRAFAIQSHIDRFLEGCKYYFIKLKYNADEITEVIRELSSKVNSDIQIWLIVTRGDPASYDTRDVLNATPQLFLLSAPYATICKGDSIRLNISKKVYRIPDQSVSQKYKNFARQDFTIAQIEASLKGYDYTLLLDSNMLVTEGQHFNVAIIKDGKILSPAKNILPGVTMNVISKMCKDHGIEFEYTDISTEMLRAADDMFASTTAGGIISVSMVDDKEFRETDLQLKIKQLYNDAWGQDKYSTRL